MASLLLRRHAHPASTLLAWAATSAACRAPADGWLVAGAALLAASWLVEWRGIAGTYEARVPRSRLVVASRVVWLGALVLSVVDASCAHWTPWQGPGVRAAGLAVGAAGIALRLWSMRTLARAFSYDLKVEAGQELIRSGPYRWLRHPSYTGMLLWSVALGAWNPSVPGAALLLASTLPQLAHRIAAEEALLAAHFGARWDAHARATARLVPWIW